MSRPTAAVRLLLVSLPFVLSLPQVLPPYQLLNATEVFSSPTGVPEPAPLLDSGIEDGTGPDLSGEDTDGFVPPFPPIPIIAASPVAIPFDGPPIPFDGPTIGDTLPIEPGIGDDPGPPGIFVDPLLPTGPSPDTLPAVPTPIDSILPDVNPGGPIDLPPPAWDIPPTAPTVSVKNFLSIIQPLIDLIGDLSSSLPGSDALSRHLALKGSSHHARQVASKPVANSAAEAATPAEGTVGTKETLPLFGALVNLIKEYNKIVSTKTPGNTLGKRDTSLEASSDALLKFYAALASNQRSDGLQESFEDLDDSTKATVVNALEAESARLELAKREGQQQGLVGMDFINTYTNEFHEMYPILENMRPDIAAGLENVLNNPKVPLPPVGSLNLDNVPDRLRKFVLDMYTFFDMLTDDAIPLTDRMQFLQGLGDGMQLRKRQVVPGSSPTWDTNRVMASLQLFAKLSPATQSLAATQLAQLFDPYNDPAQKQHMDLNSHGGSPYDFVRGGSWEYYQFVLMAESLSAVERAQLQVILEQMGVVFPTVTPPRRAMRRGLRIRQDEGADLSYGSQDDTSYDDPSSQSYDDADTQSYDDPDTQTYDNSTAPSYDDAAPDAYDDPTSQSYDDPDASQTYDAGADASSSASVGDDAPEDDATGSYGDITEGPADFNTTAPADQYDDPSSESLGSDSSADADADVDDAPDAQADDSDADEDDTSDDDSDDYSPSAAAEVSASAPTAASQAPWEQGYESDDDGVSSYFSSIIASLPDDGSDDPEVYGSWGKH